MKPPQGSLVVPTLDKLYQLLTPPEAELPEHLVDVQVLYGPPAANDQVSADVLQLGPGDFDNPGVSVRRTLQPSLGSNVYVTSVDVLVWLATYSGETDMAALMAHTNDIFGAVKKLVDDNKVVAGCWDRLSLGGDESWSPVQTEDGATVVVLFTIVADAIG